jgi:UDP-N-acetylmuramate-alanine ligase
MTATIEARAPSFPGRRLVLAFQPHRYTRTRDLFEDFVRVLSTVDVLVPADVYPRGGVPIVAADGRALARAVRVAARSSPCSSRTSRSFRKRCARSCATATSSSRWARDRSAASAAQLSSPAQ